MRQRLAVITYGCQMNERDSEEVLGMLTAQGYEVAEAPEGADVILLNTCSVRQHAEERAYGKMGELSVLKRENPNLVLGIIGCMAKLHKEAIFKRLPAVDLIAGPAELYDLPYLLAEIQEKRQSIVHSPQSIVRTMAVKRAFRPLERKPSSDYHRPGVSAFVTIMEGCDKVCTYCIVPMTRGQEVSRPAEDIIEEIHRLVTTGYQELTLLGQNVNSYGKRFPDGSGYKGPLGRLRMLEEEPDSLLDFSQLLRLIDASLRDQAAVGVRPLPWVRFTTSHPFDAHERLFLAMRECRSVCESLHLPVQSGSNRILRAMRRGYTAEAYLKKIERLRQLLPGISVSTDIIVGFPGETEEDCEATVRLMREVQYDNAYLFKYSPRPGTEAAARDDDVPRAVKEERHQRLLALQEQIALAKHRAAEGRLMEILVEGRGKGARQWFGRTRTNDGVIVESDEDLLGRVLSVRISRAAAHTLFGALTDAKATGSTSAVAG
jgi:tRNA-2-methylthio-N6-dimethylallyladenosine synthase